MPDEGGLKDTLDTSVDTYTMHNYVKIGLRSYRIKALFGHDNCDPLQLHITHQSDQPHCVHHTPYQPLSITI